MNHAAVTRAYRRMQRAAGFPLWSSPQEAERRFTDEENKLTFLIGCADWHDREALAYMIEAARFTCGVDHANAIKFLRMALEALEKRP